jgi:hypothetical protein
MTGTVPTELTIRARELLTLWDHQQASYISHREARFDVLLDVLERTIPADGVVLDLASGPGSITARVLERMPSVSCIALDYDPVLLALGRSALAEHGDRVAFVDADLWNPAWLGSLGGRTPHAVVSSTALHWLPAAVLTRVYSDLGTLLREGGVVMNADHLRHAGGRPLFEALSAGDDARTQRVSRASGALDWDQWWAEVVAIAEFAELEPERARRFSSRPANPDLSLDFHVSALEVAGFAEAGPIWQHFDDYIVLARR